MWVSGFFDGSNTIRQRLWRNQHYCATTKARGKAAIQALPFVLSGHWCGPGRNLHDWSTGGIGLEIEMIRGEVCAKEVGLRQCDRLSLDRQ